MHHDTSSILTAPRDLPSSAATLAGDPLPEWQAPLRRWLARVRHGRLTLIWPDGRRTEVTGPAPGPSARSVGARRSDVNITDPTQNTPLMMWTSRST